MGTLDLDLAPQLRFDPFPSVGGDQDSGYSRRRSGHTSGRSGPFQHRSRYGRRRGGDLLSFQRRC
jgi:hypothetical protein